MAVKEAKLKESKHIAVKSQGMMLNWRDTFHSDTMAAIWNIIHLWEEVKDQKLQPYKSERKRSTKWYTKLFKEAANYFGTYCLCALWRKNEETKPFGFQTRNKDLLEAYRKAL